MEVIAVDVSRLVLNLLTELCYLQLAMFSRFKNAIFNVVGGIEPLPVLKDSESSPDDRTLSPKFPYSRPHFLQFHTEEEILVSADHHIRPIIVPRDISKLPWNSGYAEAVNAGKSLWNEDQACLRRAMLERPKSRDRSMRDVREDFGKPSSSPEHINPVTCLPYVYFALFDGHAGKGAAVAAANQLHHILHEKLVDVIDHLLPPLEGYMHLESSTKHGAAYFIPEREVTVEELIIGALESAFWDMDQLIGEDKQKYKVTGGCTALVALFILGKLYIANAGDSRAVLCKSRCPIPLSNDFTPETERQRIRQLAALQPELLGGEYTHMDYNRRPHQRDLGKRILYRDAHMTGWAYKTVTPDDLKIPVVYGEGKRSRVLATIGVTRGFGDHELKAPNSNIDIKPFLLSQPEVKIFDIRGEEIKDSDVLIMGTDGLWDVTCNEKAVEIVQRSLDHFPANDKSRLKYRYTSAAQDLVMHSRGKLFEKKWKTADGKAATVDDISVFVIPLAPYKEEYMEWDQEYEAIRGIYETSCETNELFGKLSLRTSPVATEKSIIRVMDKENAVDGVSLHDSSVDSASACDNPSYNIDTATNSEEKIIPYTPGQESSISVTENTSSGDHLSSNCSDDISCLSAVGDQLVHDSNESVPCTDPHIASEVVAVSEPKESTQSPNTSI